jgi:hypothetical protein
VNPNVGGRCCWRNRWFGDNEADIGVGLGPRPAGTVVFRLTNIGDAGPVDKERGEATGECEGVTALEAALEADREWI